MIEINDKKSVIIQVKTHLCCDRVVAYYHTDDKYLFDDESINSFAFVNRFLTHKDIENIAKKSGIKDFVIRRQRNLNKDYDGVILIEDITGFSGSEIEKIVNEEHQKMLAFLKKMIIACRSLQAEREKAMERVLIDKNFELEITQQEKKE